MRRDGCQIARISLPAWSTTKPPDEGCDDGAVLYGPGVARFAVRARGFKPRLSLANSHPQSRHASPRLDVEQEVDNVSVLHHVGLTLAAVGTESLGFR